MSVANSQPPPASNLEGNNRAVINGSTGAIEQTVAYYPYGAVIADLGNPTTGQPYKFGGKELITTNGLNEYDFGARQYYSAVPAFTRIDPMAEKYPWLSPYLYCANNPVNFADPSGKIIEMPKGSTKDQINSVMYNMQLLTDDKLVYKTLDDGTIRIKIASTGKGSHPDGTRLVRRLNSSKKTVTINVVKDKDNGTIDKNKDDAINMKGSDAEIRFNPESNPDIPLVNKKNGRVSYGKRPSYLGLSHEMIHADRTMRGVAYDYNLKTPHRFIDENGNPVVESMRMEEAATIGLNYNEPNDITENDIRKEHGLPLRGAYGN